MSGHVGLREDARVGHWLAARVAALFPPRVALMVSRPAVGLSAEGKLGLEGNGMERDGSRLRPGFDTGLSTRYQSS